MTAIPLSNILFLDIETVPQQPTFDQLADDWKQLWSKKTDLLLRNNDTDTPQSIYSRAGIYAEFGKIICISCGVLQGNGTEKKLALKSFSGEDEQQLLKSFAEMLYKWSPDSSRYLCAHNGKEFDFPYLCRRMIINNVPVPFALQLSGKKPWEISHLDTMELWKFGDYKSFTSLNLLAHTLGVPTPKDDIDGSMVSEVYYKEQNLPRIVTYCQKDVITVAQIYLRLNGEALIKRKTLK